MNHRDASIDLQPDWKTCIIPIGLGILLIPLAGAGLIVIYIYLRKWKRVRYRITNAYVEHFDGEHSTKIQLSEILSCQTGHNRLEKRFGLGDIVITASQGSIRLRGISQPEPLAELIERAAATERDRQELRREVQQTTPVHSTGTLDKKNELVGLWQQGLISEQDFQQEMKKFQD